jgi:RNA polymerase sigma-32 factor
VKKKPKHLKNHSSEAEIIISEEGDMVFSEEESTDNFALVKRDSLALPQGEWLQPPPESILLDDKIPTYSKGNDLYRSFTQQATSVQRLSDDEERILGYRVRDHQDSTASKKLVLHNLRLVIKMAHHYKRHWTNLMDLIQEASTGLAIASQRWDPDQGTRFGTYAVYWIRAQLTKFLMTNSRLIHTGNTRAGRTLYFQLPRIKRKLLAAGRLATVEAVAAEVGESIEEVGRIMARLDGKETSIDAPLGDSENTLSDVVANPEDISPEEQFAQQEMRHFLHGVMERFSRTLTDQREQVIWREHLIASEPKSLVELGARFGVTKQRMGQLAIRIKRAFRRHVIDELGPTTELSWLFRDD